MIHLIYVSSASSIPAEDDLKTLLHQARSRNLKQNITGMLLYDNATYMQVLEGQHEDVHEIYASICKDPRNNSHVKLVDEPVPNRDFPDWSMGFKKLESCSPDQLPGFVDIFNGRLSKNIAACNKVSAIKLLMNFATSLSDLNYNGD